MTPDRAAQIVTGRPTFASLLSECRAGYRPTLKIWPDHTQELKKAIFVLRASLRAEGVRPWPIILPEELVRVRQLTPIAVRVLTTEADVIEPRSLGEAVRSGSTYIEAPPDVLQALYERIEDAEFITDAGTTESEIAFAERAQEQSRLTMLARLADALGEKGAAASHRRQKQKKR